MNTERISLELRGGKRLIMKCMQQVFWLCVRQLKLLQSSSADEIAATIKLWNNEVFLPVAGTEVSKFCSIN